MQVRIVSTLALAVFVLLLASCAEDHSAESDSAPSASDLSQSLGFDPAELDEALAAKTAAQQYKVGAENESKPCCTIL